MNYFICIRQQLKDSANCLKILIFHTDTKLLYGGLDSEKLAWTSFRDRKAISCPAIASSSALHLIIVNDKRFKGFDACGEFLFQVKVLWEYPPTNKHILIRALTERCPMPDDIMGHCALTEEWDKLSQPLLDNVVQSMT
ncbi:hypothetical protein AVEN_144690-1 [Araneus ventricosus]|uniref:Uncharacterized protein n=1 Tax=Araneus ventricosus TaxID=182803 RepID=A0A4Y2I6E5_ARAVE|nr:hypothetical protein AVEN_144690-1 [Araneus ventricosus]